MSKKDNGQTMKNTYILGFLLMSFAFLFAFFMWAVDMGASTQILETAGYPVRLEGLLFIGIEPRIIYHVGLIGMATIFLFTLSIAFRQALRK